MRLVCHQSALQACNEIWISATSPSVKNSHSIVALSSNDRPRFAIRRATNSAVVGEYLQVDRCFQSLCAASETEVMRTSAVVGGSSDDEQEIGSAPVSQE